MSNQSRYNNFFLIVILLLLPNAIAAQQSGSINLVGQWNPKQGGNPGIILFGDSLAYVAAGNFLHIYYLDEITDPRLISVFDMSDEISGLSLTNDTLYTLNTNLSALDVKDPYNPELIFSLDGSLGRRADNQNIISLNNLVFVGGGGSIAIYEYDNSGSLKKINDYRPDSNISSQIHLNNYKNLVLTTEHSGVRLIDFNNPNEPEIVSELKKDSLHISGRATVSNELTFISVYKAIEDSISDFYGLSIWDISDPVNPVEISDLEFSINDYPTFRTYSIASTDNYVLLGEGDVFDYKGRIKIIDVSDPINPDSTSTILLPLIVEHLAVFENYIYASDHKNIYIIDFSNPEQLEIIDSLETNDSVGILNTVPLDNTAILSDKNGSVHFINTNDPAKPIRVKSITGFEYKPVIEVYDKYLFVSDGRKVNLYDITTVNSPVLISSFDIGTIDKKKLQLKYSPPNLYLGPSADIVGGYDELKALDYSTPQVPTRLDTFKVNSGNLIIDFVIKNNSLFILYRKSNDAGEFGIVDIYDISAPQAPQLLSSLSHLEVGFEKIHLHEDFLYLQTTSKYQSVYKYDISNLSNPDLIKKIELYEFDIIDMVFEDDFIFIANGILVPQSPGIYVFNNSFTNIESSYKFSTLQEINTLSSNNDLLYASWGEKGLFIFDKSTLVVEIENESSTPNNFILNQNYPNPFNPNTTISYQLSNSSEVRLEIFNSIGERVSTLVNETQLSGRYSFNFGAGDLSSGIYLYRLTVNGKSVGKKMLLLK